MQLNIKTAGIVVICVAWSNVQVTVSRWLFQRFRLLPGRPESYANLCSVQSLYRSRRRHRSDCMYSASDNGGVHSLGDERCKSIWVAVSLPTYSVVSRSVASVESKKENRRGSLSDSVWEISECIIWSLSRSSSHPGCNLGIWWGGQRLAVEIQHRSCPS